MPYAVNETFTLKAGASKLFTFDGPPETDDNIGLDLTWGKPMPGKLPKMVVTRPDGVVHTVGPTPMLGALRFEDYAPMQAGTWTVVVSNTGTSQVRLTLAGGFGN